MIRVGDCLEVMALMDESSVDSIVCDPPYGLSLMDGQVENNHPTVKPNALMRYLCRLVTQPNGLVLDPFCGSGSTGVAAIQEGFKFVGVEKGEDSAAITRERIKLATEICDTVSQNGT